MPRTKRRSDNQRALAAQTALPSVIQSVPRLVAEYLSVSSAAETITYVDSESGRILFETAEELQRRGVWR